MGVVVMIAVVVRVMMSSNMVVMWCGGGGGDDGVREGVASSFFYVGRCWLVRNHIPFFKYSCNSA